MPWQAVAWAPVGGQQASPHGNSGSKHARSYADTLRQKIYVAGGDRYGSDAGQPNIISFTPGSGAFTIELAENAAGKMPSYPDNCTWAYDSVHDRGIIARSFWFGKTFAISKQPARPDADWLTNNGIFDPNTNTYSSTVIPTPPDAGLGWGGDSNCNYGTYDPTLNALVRFFFDGAWGFTLQIIPLGDLSTFPASSHYSIGSGHPSGSFIRNYLRNIDAHARQIAIDVQGRKVYAIAQSSFNAEWRLVEVDLTNPTLGKAFPLPATFDPQEVGSGDGSDNYLCFDTLRRRIMHPQVQGYSGEVKSTIISPPTDQLTEAVASEWEVVPSLGPPYPQGNTLSYCPWLGAAVLHGGRATTSVLRPGEPMPVPTHYFILTPGTEVPPLPTGKTVRDTLVTVPVQVDVSIVEDHYRISQHQVGNPTPILTVITPSPVINFGDFPNTIIGQPYDYRGVLETVANAEIGSPVITTLVASGEDPDPGPPDPIDTTPPTITINVPTPAQVVVGTIAWDYSCTDAAGIKIVEARVNGALVGPTFDTTVLPNGDATFSVRAVDNSTNENENTVSVTFTVNNPAPPDPPDPTPEPIPTAGTSAMFVVPIRGHMGYVVWAEVTNGREAIFAKTASAWPAATPAEVAEIQAGRIAEASGILKDLNDATLMEQAVALKLAEWQADVAQKCASPLHNLFFNGEVWGVRA